MFCGWEGNRRSGVALAMRHRLSGIPTYRLNGLEKGDEAPKVGTFFEMMLILFIIGCSNVQMSAKQSHCKITRYLLC